MFPESERPPSAAEIVHPGTERARDERRAPPLRRFDLQSVQSVCLIAIAVLLGLNALRDASQIFLPIAIALLASAALRPVVRALYRARIPTPVGAGIVVIGALTAIAFGVSVLSAPASEWLERAPHTLREIEQKVQSLWRPIERVAEATARVADIASLKGAEPEVAVQDHSFATIVVASARSLLIGFALSFSLLYFLLASSKPLTDLLARAIPDASRSSAKTLLDEAEQQVSRYLLTVLVVNIGLGSAVWIAMWFLRMPSPLLWGVMAGVLNFVPYLGAFVTTIVLTGVALISFDDTGRALLVPLTYIILNGVENMAITPALLGRRLALDPIALLIAVALGSWLWGVAGAIVAAPMLAIGKIAVDEVRSRPRETEGPPRARAIARARP